MNEISVAIVDDDPSVLRSTDILLESLGYDTFPFSSAASFLEEAKFLSVDCLILVVRMPGMSGLELQERLKTLGYTWPVIFITAHGDVPLAVAAVRSGAADFIEKPFTSEQLTDAINYAIKFRPAAKPDRSSEQDAREQLGRLTRRERDVFDLLVLGETNKAIGRTLGISPRTVDVHRQRLRTKLAADRLADLIRIKQAAG